MSADQDKPADAAPARFLTVGLNLRGRRCLVVGGGKIGERKARTLVEYGAEVTVIAPEIGESLRERAACVEAPYAASFLDGVHLVVAATDDAELNDAICADAEARGVLACDVSAGRKGSIIFAATVEATRDEVVAVHTHGRSPSHTRSLRDRIAEWLRSGR
jgi:siroheme synthase-like protein